MRKGRRQLLSLAGAVVLAAAVAVSPQSAQAAVPLGIPVTPEVLGHAAEAFSVSYVVPYPYYDDICHMISLGVDGDCYGAVVLSFLVAGFAPGTQVDMYFDAHFSESFQCYGFGAPVSGLDPKPSRRITLTGTGRTTDRGGQGGGAIVRANGQLLTGGPYNLHSPNPSWGIVAAFPCGPNELAVRTAVTLTDVLAHLTPVGGPTYDVVVPGVYRVAPWNYSY